MLILNKESRERKQMQLEGLLFEAHDKADWSKIFPPLNQAGCKRLDEIQGLVARVTSRIDRIRKHATQTGDTALLALLDYPERSGKA